MGSALRSRACIVIVCAMLLISRGAVARCCARSWDLRYFLASGTVIRAAFGLVVHAPCDTGRLSSACVNVITTRQRERCFHGHWKRCSPSCKMLTCRSRDPLVAPFLLHHARCRSAPHAHSTFCSCVSMHCGAARHFDCAGDSRSSVFWSPPRPIRRKSDERCSPRVTHAGCVYCRSGDRQVSGGPVPFIAVGRLPAAEKEPETSVAAACSPYPC